MTELNHTFTLTIGDRWDDGHGKYDTYHFKSNKSAAEIKELYGVASKMHNLDVTRQCEEYEDQSFTDLFIQHAVEVFGGYPEYLEKLTEAFLDENGSGEIVENWVDRELYVDIYLWTAKLVSADLVWERVRRSNDIEIGGYGFYH